MAQEILTVANEVLMKYVCEILSAGKTVTIRVRGNSMYPFLRDNKDCVTLKEVKNSKDLSAGDIILFRYSSRYLLHRIVRKEGNTLYVRGDNRRVKGYEVIGADAVIGVACSVTRDGCIVQCHGWMWRSYSMLWMAFYPCIYYMRNGYVCGAVFFKRLARKTRLI